MEKLKELLCSWPPYSSGFDTEWDKLNATRHTVTSPPKGLGPRILLLLLPPLSPCARVCVGCVSSRTLAHRVPK
jgi:hypothetical protein